MQNFDSMAFAEKCGFAENGLARMISEGTYPASDGTLVSSGGRISETWSQDLLREWFSHRHAEQGAYAAIGGIGEEELGALGGYVCPTESRWIWTRRPSLFAAYLRGRVTVYPVIGFATDRPLFDGLAHEGTVNATVEAVHTARKQTGFNSFTYFSLDIDNPIGSFTLDQQVRAGGTISPDDLRRAISHGTAQKFAHGHVIF